MNIKQKYCGCITIVGKANVGKSTLINQIIGKKISIESRKKNTTQKNIIGIKTEDCYQFIFVDTPGFFFDKKNDYIEYKKKFFYKTVRNSTLIMLMIDRLYWEKDDETVFNKLKKNNIPIIIIINKIDKIDNKNILLPFIDELKKKVNNSKIIPLSAKKIKNIVLLKNIIKSYLPEKSYIYPENYITTNSQFFTISEIIREQLILFLGDELPSIIKVKIESFQKKENELYIRALILVKNTRQKKIVIGHDALKIKKISILSRKNIERELKKTVHLILWVKN